MPTPEPPRWLRRSSLVPLTRLAAASAAGDALVTVALANTVFFKVPAGEARGRVALYLLVTMAPFALVAPVIGPLLDRARSGRRLAIGATLVGRAALAWVMAGRPNGLRIYPAAFGVLVLTKAYGIARAAAVPRLLPPDTTLLGANARLIGAGLATSTVAALAGLGLGELVGYGWTLRLAALLFLATTILAARLPHAVDSPDTDGRDWVEPLRLPSFGPTVRASLLAAVSLRAFSGFVTIFLAFQLRRHGSTVDVGLLALAVAVGSGLGTALGAGLRRSEPQRLLVGAVLVATVVCAAAATSYHLGTALVAATASAITAALGKLALDATLQRDVEEDVRGQAFARSETVLQLAWVAGGAAGLAVPPYGSLGLGLAAAGLAAASVAAVRGLHSAPVT